VTFDDINALYTANQPLIASLGALAGVAVLLVAANRLRAMKEHRATLLVANILTTIAAALATAVSASGMWKFFTDILGETPLRIAFFAFIEIALFASALLARSRLLRDPEKGTTGIDGIAVWVLAGLTATLSALDSDSFREVCLRLVAPLVAAWMWERALAAERNSRLGKAARRINWAITPERIFVWLRLAEASDRDVSQVDRARRRAKLGRARLHLHLLQSRKTFTWRVRRAHRTVVRQAMQAAEHVGLADFPDAANEREAMQMYMATLYGFVDATSPRAVAHLHAWQTGGEQTSPDGGRSAIGTAETTLGVPSVAAAFPSPRVNGADGHLAPPIRPAQAVSPIAAGTDFAVPPAVTLPSPIGAHTDNNGWTLDHTLVGRLNGDTAHQAAGPVGAHPNRTHEPDTGEDHASDDIDDDWLDNEQTDDDADTTAVQAMRRFWDNEVSNGRIPTGAELSRATGVLPSTGLGRRKRREWMADLPERVKIVQ